MGRDEYLLAMAAHPDLVPGPAPAPEEGVVDHLDAGADASAAFVGFNLHFHTLAKARLIGNYGRK